MYFVYQIIIIILFCALINFCGSQTGGWGGKWGLEGEKKAYLSWTRMPLSLSHDSPPLPLLSRLSLSYPKPPPLHSFSPSVCRQGWIPAFISTIQPLCLLATEHGSFNCPLHPLFYPSSYKQYANCLYPHILCFYFQLSGPEITLWAWLLVSFFCACVCVCVVLGPLKPYQCHTWGRQTGRRGCSVRMCHSRIQQVHKTHTQSMGEDRTWPSVWKALAESISI